MEEKYNCEYCLNKDDIQDSVKPIARNIQQFKTYKSIELIVLLQCDNCKRLSIK